MVFTRTEKWLLLPSLLADDEGFVSMQSGPDGEKCGEELYRG